MAHTIANLTNASVCNGCVVGSAASEPDSLFKSTHSNDDVSGVSVPCSHGQPNCGDIDVVSVIIKPIHSDVDAFSVASEPGSLSQSVHGDVDSVASVVSDQCDPGRPAHGNVDNVTSVVSQPCSLGRSIHSNVDRVVSLVDGTDAHVGQEGFWGETETL